MKFSFKFTDTNTGESVEIAGGRTALWDAQDAADAWPARKSNEQRLDFAWGYFAAKRAGVLADLGIDGMDAEQAVDYIADNYDLHISDGAAPLAAAPSE